MKAATPEALWQAQATLGESPLWCSTSRALYWSDILGRQLMRLTPASGERKVWHFDAPLCSIVKRAGGGFVVTTASQFAFFNEGSGALTPMGSPLSSDASIRFNDGKCDAHGRFWAGTMHMSANRHLGGLYRLDSNLSFKLMDSGYLVSNGPAWSVDGSVMYHNESARGQIFAFDFDLARGQIRNKRLFLQLKSHEGQPDGMTVDSSDCLWVAHFGGARMVRYSPDARVQQVIELPASQVSSCAFGDTDLKTLFVTTATIGLRPDQRAAQPLAGSLFAVRVDVPGLPPEEFRSSALGSSA